MTNIWGFLMQTIEVSLVAVLLLVMKRIFQDKLSPRWQYGIWSLLVISLLVPVGYFGSFILPTIRIFIEATKTMIESGLHSQYIHSYEVIRNFMVLPWIDRYPQSITDYLFIIYVIGMIICLIMYFARYWSLKMIIKKGQQPSETIIQQITKVCQHYHLKSCDVVVLENLPSAFVFGIFKPILVLPKEYIDDKIILHELLHLKNKDILQNVIWNIFKSLHWCNPFLRYVFQVIHNDIESLCDQRVLELIEGEERREYGRILLSMTNDKYPSAFGTSSISNGGKNIKKRIEAIVRFKQYPRGMFLVSICIGILLLPIVITGISSQTYIENGNEDIDSFDYQLSISSARLVECDSITSAIDLYAKGLLKDNDLYLISVMPTQQQSNYIEVLKNKPTGIYSYNGEDLYKIVNLEKVNEQLYNAYLLFEINEKEFDEEDEIYDYYIHYSIVPIQISKEHGWKVQQTGDVIQEQAQRKYYTLMDIPQLPKYKSLTQETKTGKIQINVYNIQTVYNTIESQDIINIDSENIFNTGNTTFSYEPNFNATIDQCYQYVDVTYTNQQDTPLNHIGINITRLDNMNDEVEDEQYFDSQAMQGITTSDDGIYEFHTVEKEEDKTLNNYYISRAYETTDFFQSQYKYPEGYQINIWLNKEKAETIRMKVGGSVYE